MFSFELNDSAHAFGTASEIRFDFARALRLLAIATAPSPGSRYQPGTSWCAVKYATAIEPRIAASGNQPAIANSGISDLDPHQKTVLADELGMALSLGAIDEAFGIDGLSDCYGLWKHGLLKLHKSGRHRRIPDFLVYLRKPLDGSRVALIECKGSTLANGSTRQLRTACQQLRNVKSVNGPRVKKAPISRVATACTLQPGKPVKISVYDPPIYLSLPEDIELRLRANYVALELAALGDIVAADAVRACYGIPSWQGSGIEIGNFPRTTTLQINQTVVCALPARRRRSRNSRTADDEVGLLDRECLASATLIVNPSHRAKSLREDPNNDTALQLDYAPPESENVDAVSREGIEIEGSNWRRQERYVADDGSISELSINGSAAR
jgi:hypothetical protein